VIIEAVELQAKKVSAMGNASSNAANDDQLPESGEFDRTQELTWALLDERITDVEVRELENLLRTDKKALEIYARCMQLHADLACHFAPPAKNASAKLPPGLPIFGLLNSEIPSLGADSPTTGEAR
jgi:hypothetical protein